MRIVSGRDWLDYCRPQCMLQCHHAKNTIADNKYYANYPVFCTRFMVDAGRGLGDAGRGMGDGATLIIRLQVDFSRSEYTVSRIKTPGYAPVPCHITGIFRPLPGSRHFY